MDKIYSIFALTVDQEAIRFVLRGQSIVVPLSESGSWVLPRAKLEHLRIFEQDDDGLGI